MGGGASDNGGNGESKEEFDLNIAPIIDCFTVLIAYLLVSASFLSLAVFDVGVAVSGEQPTPDQAMPKEPPYSLVVALAPEHEVELKLTGGAEDLHLNIPIRGSRDSIDYDQLKTRLSELQQKYPKIDDVSVAADGTVIYKEMIRTIESIKPTFPKVFISGESVSVSSNE